MLHPVREGPDVKRTDMIPDNDTIIFRPTDQPELQEIDTPEPAPRRFTPPPSDWRPFGAEW